MGLLSHHHLGPRLTTPGRHRLDDMSSLDAAYAKWADLECTASEDDEPQRPRAAPSKKRSKVVVDIVSDPN